MILRRMTRRMTRNLRVRTKMKLWTQIWTSANNGLGRPNNERKKKAKAINMDKSFTVRLSVRAFLKFLSVHVVSSTTIACAFSPSFIYFLLSLPNATMPFWLGVCEHHCMILYVYIGDAEEAGGVLTFYIPARLNGSEY